MPLKDIYYTISEAAKELNVSRQTIYRWITDNKIEVEKIGGVTLIEKPKVTEYAGKRFQEFALESMDNMFISRIKEEYGYSQGDEVVRTETEDDYLVFLVTRENGTREKIKIGSVEVTISVGRKQEEPETSIDFKEVIKTKERRTKSRGKIK